MEDRTTLTPAELEAAIEAARRYPAGHGYEWLAPDFEPTYEGQFSDSWSVMRLMKRNPRLIQYG